MEIRKIKMKLLITLLSILVQDAKAFIRCTLFMIGATISLTSISVFAQTNQSSQQQSQALPAPSVIPLPTNEISEGFGNATDLQSLTGLNQAAMQNDTGNQSVAGGQQQQQQSNQSASNQTGNQSAAGGQATTATE
jgi:hypothetical protein